MSFPRKREPIFPVNIAVLSLLDPRLRGDDSLVPEINLAHAVNFICQNLWTFPAISIRIIVYDIWPSVELGNLGWPRVYARRKSEG